MRRLSHWTFNSIMVIMALFVIATGITAVIAITRANDESQARCDQVGRLTDAVAGIAGFVNQPNPSRTPQQQEAANQFLVKANDLLNGARPC